MAAAYPNGNAISNITIPLAFNAPQVDVTSLLQYTVGDQVNVAWASPFEHTTVAVWQGPSEDGVYATQTIAANFTQNHTMVMWEAGPLGNASLKEGFQFRLQKGHAPNSCRQCVRNGPIFQVQEVSSNSTKSPSGSAASTSPTAQASSSNPTISASTRLGIGLGVGLGAAFVIALLGLLLFFLRRRQNKQKEQIAAKQEKQDQLRYSSAGESWKTRSSGPPISYHERFEFETSEGTPREGWESL